MKIINRDVDYSVRALLYLAANRGGAAAVPDIAAASGVPGPFLRKILQKLDKAGVLRSKKGRGGGFSLAGSPDRISLARLIEIFQGPITMGDCVFKKKLCRNHRTCVLRRKIGAIEDVLLAEIGKISLKDLA